MAEEAKGFLGRWARRKTEALEGKTLEEPAPPPKVNVVLPAQGQANPAPAVAVSADTAAEADSAPPPEDALLSLDDVKLLTKDSDFKPFMAQGVGADVRNAAMKKLFSDPHFNVMDGLDIYIDDYSKSDPIPESMLRQMTSAKFLKLFDDEDDPEKLESASASASATTQNTLDPTVQTVKNSSETMDSAPASTVLSENPSQSELSPDFEASRNDHANIDLRLQPDYAAPAPVAGRDT